MYDSTYSHRINKKTKITIEVELYNCEMSATTSFYILFESAAGYGLFSILESEDIGNLVAEVQTGITDLARFQRVVKMVAFHPFDSAENALLNINAITEHQVTENLKVNLTLLCSHYNK